LTTLLLEELPVLLALDAGGDVTEQDVVLREILEFGVGERAAL